MTNFQRDFHHNFEARGQRPQAQSQIQRNIVLYFAMQHMVCNIWYATSGLIIISFKTPEDAASTTRGAAVLFLKDRGSRKTSLKVCKKQNAMMMTLANYGIHPEKHFALYTPQKHSCLHTYKDFCFHSNFDHFIAAIIHFQAFKLSYTFLSI